MIAEILEALFVKEPELVTALLAELNRADTATLAKLFDSRAVPAEMPPAVALAATEAPIATEAPAEPGPTWSKPSGEPLSRWDEPPRWDLNGYRLNRPPHNVFPRNEPRGSHWSR